jgi:hypothetical protein
MRPTKTLEEIDQLIDIIPIECEELVSNSAKFATDVSIDSQFSFRDIHGILTRSGTIESGLNGILTFRDIIKLYNKFLYDASFHEILFKNNYSSSSHQHRYYTRQLRQTNVINAAANAYDYINNNSQIHNISAKNLLFDFCLAALDGDILNAILYLTHSIYLLGLRGGLVLLLYVIVNESYLLQDTDIREFISLLAILSEPNNIGPYYKLDKDGVFSKRYAIYLKEIQKLTPIFKKIRRSHIDTNDII